MAQGIKDIEESDPNLKEKHREHCGSIYLGREQRGEYRCHDGETAVQSLLTREITETPEDAVSLQASLIRWQADVLHV